jgi:hypothetical protein
MHVVTRNIHRQRWVRSGAFSMWHYRWKLRAVKQPPPHRTISDRGPQWGAVNLGSTIHSSQTVNGVPSCDTQLEFSFWPLLYFSRRKAGTCLWLSVWCPLWEEISDLQARSYNGETRLLPSSCPSVRPHVLARLALDYFPEIFEIVQKFQIWRKSDKNVGYFTWRVTYSLFLPTT